MDNKNNKKASNYSLISIGMVFIVIGLLLFPDSPYARYGFLAAGIIFITASMVISFRKRKN